MVKALCSCVALLAVASGAPADQATQERVRRLIAELKDGDERARSQAAYDLERLGPAAKAAVPALLGALRDRQIGGYQAACALRVIDPDNEQGVRLLVRDLSHPQADARYNAAGVLGLFGARARAALPALVAVLRVPDRAVRLAAASSLHEIEPGHPAAVPVLAALVLDPQADAYLPTLGVA